MASQMRWATMLENVAHDKKKIDRRTSADTLVLVTRAHPSQTLLVEKLAS
jgi:hypothetical protein